MTEIVDINDVTADAVRQSGDIFATDGYEYVLIRKNLKLPPFVDRDVEAPLSPQPLNIRVDSLSVESLQKIRISLEALGFNAGFADLEK